MFEAMKKIFNEKIGWSLAYRGYNGAVATLVLLDFLSDPTPEKALEYLPDVALHVFEAAMPESNDILTNQLALVFNGARLIQAGYNTFNQGNSQIPLTANLADIPNHVLNMYHRFSTIEGIEEAKSKEARQVNLKKA